MSIITIMKVCKQKLLLKLQVQMLQCATQDIGKSRWKQKLKMTEACLKACMMHSMLSLKAVQQIIAPK